MSKVNGPYFFFGINKSSITPLTRRKFLDIFKNTDTRYPLLLLFPLNNKGGEGFDDGYNKKH